MIGNPGKRATSAAFTAEGLRRSKELAEAMFER
jgi:hypothetical protein